MVGTETCLPRLTLPRLQVASFLGGRDGQTIDVQFVRFALASARSFTLLMRHFKPGERSARWLMYEDPYPKQS